MIGQFIFWQLSMFLTVAQIMCTILKLTLDNHTLNVIPANDVTHVYYFVVRCTWGRKSINVESLPEQMRGDFDVWCIVEVFTTSCDSTME